MEMWGLKYFFQLRYLQTLNNISQENNSTIVFPVPIDIISEMMRGDSKERSKVTNTYLLTGNISLKQSRLKERTFLFYNVKRVLSLPSGRIIIDQSGQKSDVMSQTFLSIMTTGSWRTLSCQNYGYNDDHISASITSNYKQGRQAGLSRFLRCLSILFNF